MENIYEMNEEDTLKFDEMPFIPIEPLRNDGWLSPDGKFTKCKNDEHEDCARFLNNKYAEEVRSNIKINFPELTPQDLEGQSPRFVIGKAGFLQFSHGKPNYLSTEILTEKQKEELIYRGFALPEEITLEMIHQLPNEAEILRQINSVDFSNQTREKLSELVRKFYDNPSLGIKFQVFFNDKVTPNKEVEFLYSIIGQGFGEEHVEEDEGINYARAASIFRYRFSPKGDMALIYNFIHHAGDSQQENPLIAEYQIIYQTKFFAENQAEHMKNLNKNI